jgi:hypothetical protein
MLPSSGISVGKVNPVLPLRTILTPWTFILMKLIGSSPLIAKIENGGILLKRDVACKHIFFAHSAVKGPFKEQSLKFNSSTSPSLLMLAGRVRPILPPKTTLTPWTFILITPIGSSPVITKREAVVNFD